MVNEPENNYEKQEPDHYRVASDCFGSARQRSVRMAARHQAALIFAGPRHRRSEHNVAR